MSILAPGVKVATKMDAAAATPRQRSPLKRKRSGITLAQKQALIDNLQLEVTERARRLRAQYNLQAQGLRSRIEIRVNRIPMALRKLTMGELLEKLAAQQQRLLDATRPPPVPEKDVPRQMAPTKPTYAVSTASQGQRRPQKRTSDEIYGDKENEAHEIEYPKKRTRVAPAAEAATVAPAQVLSPTSSNARLRRDRPVASPAKSFIARPVSPVKPVGPTRPNTASNILTNLVEKAKGSRSTATRKTTTTSNTSASSSGTTAAPRGRRAAAAPAPKATTTRSARRTSNTSHSSESSTSTVVKKPTARATVASKTTATAAAKKATTAAAARKTTTTRTAAVPTAGTTRVLRKRG